MSSTDNKPLNQPSAPTFVQGRKLAPILHLQAPPRLDDLVIAIGEGLAILLNALGDDPDNEAYGPGMLRAADRLVLLTARGSS